METSKKNPQSSGLATDDRPNFVFRVASWLWEKSTDLFFNILTLGRWSKYKKTEGGREAFMLGWFYSDKVTWVQAFVLFKWSWVKATIFPAVKAAWAKAVSAVVVTAEALNIAL